MNEQTLRKLKNNPHYKMSSKQLEEFNRIDKKPMIKFGNPEIHNNNPILHPVNVVKSRKKYEKKKAKPRKGK